MPKKRFSAEQIVTLLRQIEVSMAQGNVTPVACRDAGISQQSYYRWRKEYGGLEIDQAKRMKDLEAARRWAGMPLPFHAKNSVGSTRIGEFFADARQQAGPGHPVVKPIGALDQPEIGIWPRVCVELGHDYPRRVFRVEFAQPLLVWCKLDRKSSDPRRSGRNRKDNDVAGSDRSVVGDLERRAPLRYSRDDACRPVLGRIDPPVPVLLKPEIAVPKQEPRNWLRDAGQAPAPLPSPARPRFVRALRSVAPPDPEDQPQRRPAGAVP